MTIKTKKTIENLIKADGVLEGRQTNSIWQYESANGEILYAVFMNYDHDMFTSPYVKNPVLLWSIDEGKLQDPS